MKRLFLVALALLLQASVVLADPVVFGGNTVVDRSLLTVVVSGSLSGKETIVSFQTGVRPTVYHFVCSEKYDDKLMQKTIDIALKTFEKEKYIDPFDIFRKAGLTGCHK